MQNVTLCLANVQTLEEQKLSQRDVVNSNSVNCLKSRFITSFVIRLRVLLSNLYDFIVAVKFKEDEILPVNLQVHGTFQRVAHVISRSTRGDDPLLLASKAGHTDSFTIESYIFMRLWQENAIDSRFPQLKRLMLEKGQQLLGG